MRAFRTGDVLSPKFNHLYLIFSYKGVKRAIIPQNVGTIHNSSPFSRLRRSQDMSQFRR
jgi:hypothetical protein